MTDAEKVAQGLIEAANQVAASHKISPKNVLRQMYKLIGDMPIHEGGGQSVAEELADALRDLLESTRATAEREGRDISNDYDIQRASRVLMNLYGKDKKAA